MSEHSLHPELVKDALSALRNPEKCTIQISGQKFVLKDLQKLGAGGTKTAYLYEQGNEKRVVALPNVVDEPRIALKKWQRALNEPENTDTLRKLGLLTNTLCRVEVVEIHQIPFPAIIMTPYSELPFSVGDSKNPDRSRTSERIPFPSTEEFKIRSRGIINDVCTLLRNGVRIGRDSISIASTERGWRLFLNDLGSMTIDTESQPTQELVLMTRPQ